MPANSLRVTLLAPGCFSVVAQTADDAPNLPENESTPDVNDSQAIATQTKVYEQALAAALQQPIPDMGALPVAMYQFPVDTGEPAPAHCVCVELIHLQADKDNARLVPEPALNISDEESNELLDALNKLINPDGLNVARSSAGRCYLTGMPATALDTWPAHAVANGKIANFLPRRSNAGDWRRLLTEVQMLFHAHPVNAVRAELRQLPINGMWFWGGMQDTQLVPVANLVLVTDDAYAQGLGAALNVNTRALASSSWKNLSQDYVQNSITDKLVTDEPKTDEPKTDEPKTGEPKTDEPKTDEPGTSEPSGGEPSPGAPIIDKLVIVDLCAYQAWLRGDQVALVDAKRRLHEQWITPVQNAVTQGLVSEFVLDGCEGQAIIERQATRAKSDLLGSGWLERLSLKRLMPSWFLRAKDK